MGPVEVKQKREKKMTSIEFTAKARQAKLQLERAVEVYQNIKEMNDYEPCPEARAELQKATDKYNQTMQTLKN